MAGAEGGWRLEQELVRATRLGRQWAGRWALQEVDLAVAPGEMFGLVGPDGAGKSTLIRLLCGSLSPHAGEARVLGRSVRQEGRRIARLVGYLSQGLGLYHDLTVAENLRFCAALHGIRRPEERIRSLLRLTGLAGHEWKLAGALSGGMRQKLGLACTLLHEPPLVFLDEPTTGVDPVSRREFWDLIGGLHRRGITFVVSTPYMDEAERCQRIAFLFEGRVLATGAPAEFRRTFPAAVYAVTVPGGQVLRLARGLASAYRAHVAGNVLRLYSEPGTPPDAVREACCRAGYPQVEVRPVPPGLDDVFQYLIRTAGGGEARGTA